MLRAGWPEARKAGSSAMNARRTDKESSTCLRVFGAATIGQGRWLGVRRKDHRLDDVLQELNSAVVPRIQSEMYRSW
jgi:hypothetical protein